MSRCRSCGEAILERARFCSSCGAPVVEAKLREARKVVTVLFCDLAASTGLAERLEPEALRRLLERYFTCARDALERHGGTVEKFIGDAVMAVFGIPSVHEDDALRAVRAAVELREEVGRLSEKAAAPGVELVVRIGVNTGEVVTGEPAGDSLVTGDAVVIAKRLEESAPPGQILLGPWTHTLVCDAVEVDALPPVTLKGKSEPLAAYLVRAIRPGRPGRARRLDSPLVGRAHELAALREAFAEAVSARECRLVTVLGPAGIGKTRLTHELATAVADARVLRGRCLPYGDGITYWPIVEIVREAVGLSGAEPAAEAGRRIGAVFPDSADRDRAAAGVAAAVGIGDGAAAEELFWAVRAFLEELGRARPLLVVIDDLQWAEPVFLDLLEYLVSRSRSSPVLLCCLGRPELLDVRPGWSGRRERTTTVELEALPPDDSRVLIGNLLGSDLADVRERVLAAAEGNPLFVEELLRMLIDEGLLRRTDDGWSLEADSGRLALPPTINALLSARLDRLRREERVVIGRAAVVGEVFSWSTVAALVPPDLAPTVGTCLQELVRKELIRPVSASGTGEDEFRFGHILVRDAAYAGLPKDARAELHERVARLIEARYTGGIEVDEIGGYHLEQAARLQGQLDPLDPRVGELAAEAAARLAAAARRAVTRDDSTAAASLFERALALLGDEDPGRAELLVAFADVLRLTGRLDEAAARLQEAQAHAQSAGLSAVAARAGLDLAFLRWYTNPSEGTDAALRSAESAIKLFERVGDKAGLAHAWAIAGDVHWIRCEIGKMQEALERALPVLDAAGRVEQTRIRSALARAAAFGPTPVEEALRLCRELARQSEDDRTLASLLDLYSAQLEALRGNFAEARAQVERAREPLEELGKRILVGAAQRLFAGQIELLAGDAVAAEAHFRDGYETLKSLGDQGNLAGLGVHLAAALHAQGRDDEADALVGEALRLASPDDIEVQVLWRVTRARIRAAGGAPVEAETLVREAISIAERTDAPNIRADAQLALALVLREQARDTDAQAAAGRALELYEAKGNLIGVREARELLAAAGRVSAR